MSTSLTLPRPGLVGRLRSAAVAFVAEPASARPLAALRVGTAAVLLAQAVALAAALTELFGPRGIVQWSITEALAAPGVPHVGWLARALAPLGVGPETCLRLTFAAYVAGLSALMVGWHTRAAAVVAWLTHLALNTSGQLSIYGVDQFAHIALFYCACLPAGARWSCDVRAGRASGQPSAAARLGLRVLQLHVCIAYLAAAAEKAVGEQWWNGEAVWRATTRPDLARLDLTWLASAPWLAQLLCWGTLLVEGGYTVFVWPRATRRLWVLATIGLHVGIAVSMGLVSFSAMMIVLNVAAFLVSAEPPAPAAALRPSSTGR
jgi:hypothetical protein